MNLKTALNCSIGFASFLLSAYTIFALANFFSFHSVDAKTTKNGGLLWNMMLLCIFILQHSLMKRLHLTEKLQNSGLAHLERSFYVGSTNLCLLFLINFWSTSSTLLWQLDLDTRIFSWVHFLSWGLIYSSALLLDLPELLGLRQIAEHCQLSQVVESDASLSRLYSHMRHPSFSAIAIVLLARPSMTLDRALLAAVLISYMYLAWNPDLEDLRYQEVQWRRKKAILRAL